MSRTVTYILTAAFALGLAGAALADLNKGLIGAWTFDDGTARDQVGKNDGKLLDGAKIVDKGKFGKTADFDGAKAHIQIPDSKTWEVMKDAFSVAAWAFVRTGRDHSAVAWKGDKVGWGPNFLFRMATTSNTNITWGACISGREGWFATDNAIKPNEWLHLCLTADGKLVTAYVNAGAPPATGGGQNPNPVDAPYLTFPGKPIELGVGRAVGGNVGNDAYLDGQVDEVLVYNRALTAAEVKELAGGKGPTLAVTSSGKLATQWAKLKR